MLTIGSWYIIKKMKGDGDVLNAAMQVPGDCVGGRVASAWGGGG